MQISEAESIVMDVLWRQQPLAAEDVVAARLVARPVLQRQAWMLGESQGLLERLFDGRVAPLVAHFSEHRKLSRKDIAELRKLLEELDDDDRRR